MECENATSTKKFIQIKKLTIQPEAFEVDF